ncbi:RNA polymerase sigma factor [Streptomyces sp. NPDC088254]|uniref:RNA polymerase sigma factor n=1 Tax=Streptomyces sp. NPDC088254 TaxID=3365847 RepID=UPI0037F15D48
MNPGATPRHEPSHDAAALLLDLLPTVQRRATAVAPASSADDATQLACERLLRHSAEFTRHPNPRAYAIRTVTNIAYDMFRLHQREVLTPQPPETAPSQDDLNHREATWEATRLISTLPPAQKTAVLLVDLYGYTIDQAAGLLGVHRGSVARSRTRAHEKLRSSVRPAGRKPSVPVRQTHS